MNEKSGFRRRRRTRRAKPDASIKQENPTRTAQQIFAKIPGHDVAEVVEMVFKYTGKRKKLDHIFVQWPGIGPNIRRFKMTPFIRIKKKKLYPWHIRAIDKAARYLVKKALALYHFIVDPSKPLVKYDPSIIQPHHLRHNHEHGDN